MVNAQGVRLCLETELQEYTKAWQTEISKAQTQHSYRQTLQDAPASPPIKALKPDFLLQRAQTVQT
jgi:hypothetical protein